MNLSQHQTRVSDSPVEEDGPSDKDDHSISNSNNDDALLYVLSNTSDVRTAPLETITNDEYEAEKNLCSQAVHAEHSIKVASLHFAFWVSSTSLYFRNVVTSTKICYSQSVPEARAEDFFQELP